MKIMIKFFTLAMLLMCLISCDYLTIQNDTNPTTTQNVCNLLNELVDKDYSKIKIDIVTSTDFAELCSNYVLTQFTVVYSIEKLNLFPSDGNITDLPSNYKTTVTGYALIENGRIIEIDGNKNVTIPSYDELKGHFYFDKSNFKNVDMSTNYFEADVISVSKFYGANVNMINLNVKVEYTETFLTKITLSYRTANATVKTTYSFEKIL